MRTFIINRVFLFLIFTFIFFQNLFCQKLLQQFKFVYRHKFLFFIFICSRIDITISLFSSTMLIISLILLCSHFIMLIICDYNSSNIPFSERQALFDLKHYWIWTDNSHRPRWDFNDPTINPCDSINSWQGLTCIINSGVDSMIFNVIVGINLKGYNLHSPLSEWFIYKN